MLPEVLVRKPSTSSGELPPTHTVAAKFRKSSPPFRMCVVEMPKDANGTRSGSAPAGGCAIVLAAGKLGRVRPAGFWAVTRTKFAGTGASFRVDGRAFPGVKRWTLTWTVAVRFGIATWNSRT